jgi:hypothetical protein
MRKSSNPRENFCVAKSNGVYPALPDPSAWN